MTKLNQFGETPIANGKIASIVTYLEMHAQTQSANLPDRDDLSLVQVTNPDLDWYRSLFKEIGEDWLWFLRLHMADEKLGAILTSEKTEIHALKLQGRDVGLFELDLSNFPDIEIAYFGTVPDQVGTGAGRWLMTKGLELTWAKAPKRVWLHTCNLDHPAALPFYQRSGFTPYKRAIDIDDDPRLTGALEKSAAPQIPIIGKMLHVDIPVDTSGSA